MVTIFAKKAAMTGRYTSAGERVGATWLSVLPMKVLDLRTSEKHGYEAVRLTVSNVRSKRPVTKEIRTNEKPEVGGEVNWAEMIKVGDKVKVSGVSKGKGFAGVVKRHHFKGGPRTHGQSDRERAPGSSSSTTTPGRVLKGTRRAGHMGNERVSIKGLEVLEVNAETSKLLLKGSVPGATNYTLLTVTKSK